MTDYKEMGGMTGDRKLVFEKPTEADVEAMTGVMKRAFDEDSRIHLGVPEGGPDGYDNGEFIRKWYLHSGSDAFKIVLDGKIIGGINVFRNGKENFLGNIFIDTEYQNHGLGSLVWKWLEGHYPDTTKWATETPGFSRRNHYFYVNKCGFKIVRIENPMDQMEASYLMEKIMMEGKR